MRRKVRLGESDLHRIIKESVKRVLKEHKPLFTNGDVEIPVGSQSWDSNVYHYDNNGKKVRHNWETDIRDKHNKRVWKHEKPTYSDKPSYKRSEILDLLHTWGLTTKDWKLMSKEDKEDALAYWRGEIDTYPRRAESFSYPTETDLHRIVKESVNRVLIEARKNRPLKDYADEITQKWRGAKRGTIERDNLWDKYKELDRMERVHALRNGEYPTASYHGQTYTIDDPLPNATIYIHYEGAPYAWNAYPNEGESLRDYIERNGETMEDITEWWFDD